MGLSRWMTMLLEKMPCVLSAFAAATAAHDAIVSSTTAPLTPERRPAASFHL